MKKGEGWEQLVEGELRRAGLTWVQKTEPCPRIMKNLGKGRFEVVFSGGGLLDFVGCYKGCYVELDAKDITGERLSFTAHFKKSQIERMRGVMEEGGKVGVIVRFRARPNKGPMGDRMFCIPAIYILSEIALGNKSITMSQCEGWGECLEVYYMKGWVKLADWVLTL